MKIQKTGSRTLCLTGAKNFYIELINVINFIEQTMATLSSYGKRLKTQLGFNLTQQGKIANLISRKFCESTFKLLNKNFDFVSTQKTINKDKIKKQFEVFLDE